MFLRQTTRLLGLGKGLFQNKKLLFTGTTLTALFLASEGCKMYSDKYLDKAKASIATEIEKMKKQHGTQVMAFPEVNYSFDGNSYRIDFLVDQRKTDLLALLLTAITILDQNKGVTYSLKSRKDGDGIFVDIILQNTGKGSGTITLVGQLKGDRPSFKFILEKQSEISDIDLKIITQVYKEANLRTAYSGERSKNLSGSQKRSKETQTKNQSKGFLSQAEEVMGGGEIEELSSIDEVTTKLKEMGVIVFAPENKGNLADLSWDVLAGYEGQKRDIEDTVLLSLTHAEIFDEITSATRAKFERNRAKAVLFEGPPGTGKTTSAKIIASQVGIPLLYLPLESVMSKWYGESEQKLAAIFELANKLGKAIIFIDEVDALAINRSRESNEVSRRILSTLLRKIDSFESDNDTLLICATNRKDDLDQAILSRMDLSIKFDLPDVHSRREIFRRYAKHLDDSLLTDLATHSSTMSGRNIYEICKDAERRWASKRIRKEVDSPYPPFEQYLESLRHRSEARLS